MNCPSCHKRMILSGNDEVDEEVYTINYICKLCSITVVKFWGETVEKEFERYGSFL